MNPVVRQRLVGTLVLIAMAVVFWPIIFVTPETKAPLVIQPPPPAPRVDETPLPMPASPEASIRASISGPSHDDEAQVKADQRTRLNSEGDLSDAVESLAPADSLNPIDLARTAPPAIATDESGFAVAWVLQVATVSSKERASVLVDQLVAKGYEAFSQGFQAGENMLWRVQIGPKVDETRFSAIKAEVDRAFRVNSVVVRYRQAP